MSRKKFHDPKDVRVVEIRLYIVLWIWNWAVKTLKYLRGYVTLTGLCNKQMLRSSETLFFLYAKTLIVSVESSWLCLLSPMVKTPLTLAVSAIDKISRRKLMILFLYFAENRIWYFMQIVSWGDSLHEMSNPIRRQFAFFFLQKIGFEVSCKLAPNVVCWNWYPAC